MSMHRMPRAGSCAHSVLLYLVRCGGTSTPAALLRDVVYPRPLGEFEAAVLGSLMRQGLVVRSYSQVLLTTWGRQLVEPATAPATETEVAALTPGRYVPPIQPLSLKNRARLVSMRPGSLAYRDIPSRMADTRVPFKSSITTTDEAKQG